MSTLIYSPGVKVLIQTMRNGIVDVTDDLANGSVTLTENQPSTMNITLLNHRRKYDGIFTPNDVVHVSMKRITWMPIFSGYLNKVPYFGVFPRDITLTATCSLKRMKYRPWDPGSNAAVGLLNTIGGNPSGQVDGGLRDKVKALMTKVGDWPEHKIHFGEIPNDWYSRFNLPADILGGSGIISGSNLAALGDMTVEIEGPGTGALPHYSGPVRTLTTVDTFRLTGESVNRSSDDWYMRMRVAILDELGESYLPKEQEQAAERWWKNRKILVVNASKNKAVIVRMVDVGPSDPAVASELSSQAMRVIGAKSGDRLEYRFAKPESQLGPVSIPTQRYESSVIARESTPSEVDTHVGTVSTNTPTTSVAMTGWQGSRGLQPHAEACRKFVRANWNVLGATEVAVPRNIAGTSKPSNHSTGHAIDITVSSGTAKGDALRLGNAIAMWFVNNPQVFGVTGVIWFNRINTGSGWRPYKPKVSTVATRHENHLHIDFTKKETPTGAGSMGGGWPGGTLSDFANQVSSANNGADIDQGSIYTGYVQDGEMPLVNAWQWSPTVNPLSLQLGGIRALMNDTYLLDTVGKLTMASQRSYMSAPNGDFIAWFPDYFGRFGTASKMIIRDIEIEEDGFTVDWDDTNLVTHQFTAGSYTGYSTAGIGQGPSPGTEVDVDRRLLTSGIATIEMQELMESILNVSPNNPRGDLFTNPQKFLERFGARPNYEPISLITGPETEFWFAVALFMRNWAKQFTAPVNLTFMPELYPGMLAVLESLSVQAYVTSVTHSFNFSNNGGFRTTATVISPSSLDKSGLYGLPVGGATLRPPLPLGVGGRDNQFL